METETIRRILGRAFDAAGMPIHGFVGREALREVAALLSPERRSRYGVDEAGGAVVAALPYGEGPPEEPPWACAYPGRRVALARFARANWYGELVSRLKKASAAARAELAAAGVEAGEAGLWRCLANSGLPEKPLAVRARLGRIGRHGLVIVDGAGPACVLGLLLLPLDPAPPALPGEAAAPPAFATPERPGASCGSCRACVDACPTGALSADGGYDRMRCLQHWSVVEGELPPLIEAAWGERLYGCDACLEACPHFRLDPGAVTGLGLLGAGLPAAWLAEASDAEIRSRLRGSALGMRWISPTALRRNALLAGRRDDGSRGDGSRGEGGWSDGDRGAI
ncbi:MAG: 4Fe-4S binding protein [Treponema sp.]|nr:4Fe-4S binding protein [Treponema sp.]